MAKLAAPPKPTFRSRFGGLWTDLSNASESVREKLEAGLISSGEADQLNHFIDHGYLILKKAVPDELIDSLNAEVERVWQGGIPSLWVEYWKNHQMFVSPARPDLQDVPNKLLDIYSESEVARRAMYSKPILDFLTLIFERSPMAFQSLSFLRGTGQPMHQDTAYVVVSSPMELAASWIALEDIQPDAGALEYYEGSIRMKEFLFQGKYKNIQPGSTEHQRYLDSLHEQAKDMGLPRKKFLARKGDALIWAADLAHGGSQNPVPGSSRRSLVTHYCPVGIEPEYFRTANHSGCLKYRENAYYSYVIRG